MQNLGFFVPEKDECGTSLSLDTHSVGVCSFLETGPFPWPSFTKEETYCRERKEVATKEWSPTDLHFCSVPFTEDENPILANSVPQGFAGGIGKKWAYSTTHCIAKQQ